MFHFASEYLAYFDIGYDMTTSCMVGQLAHIVNTHNTDSSMHTHMHIHAHTQTQACIHTCTYMNTHMQTCTHNTDIIEKLWTGLVLNSYIFAKRTSKD